MLATAHDAELDTGPRNAAGTERFCAVSRAVRPVDEMLRFVIGPDGVTPDLKRKLPGRGIWITATRDALAEAVTRNVFARGFRRDVKVGSNLVEQTERLLTRSVLDALAISGKASQVTTGFAKTEAALMRDKVVGLIHAADAAEDGIRKLTAVLKTRPDADSIVVVRAFDTAQLDLALGRSNVVHAALLAGPSNDTFLTRFQRLERFRTGEPAGRGGGRVTN